MQHPDGASAGRRRLLRFTSYIAFATAVIALVDVLLRIPAGEWEQLEVTLAAAVLSGWLAVLVRWTKRLSDRRLSILIGAGIYVTALVVLPFIPHGAPVLALACLIPIFLALPHLDPTELRRASIAVWAFCVAYLAVGALFIAGAPGPLDLRMLGFDIVGSAAVTAVVLLLLLHHQATEQELRFLALHDGLTGLHNRVLFMDRLEHALAREERATRSAAVLYLDLDGFKEVNDRQGHDHGDEVLRTTAERLRGSVRASDTVARVGGDEFAILLEDVKRRSQALAVAERAIRAIGVPFELATGSFTLRASAGLAFSGDGGETAEALVQNADFAMYLAKQAADESVVVYHPRLRSGRDEVRSIKRALHGVAERDELRLLFQPVVRLNSGDTDEVHQPQRAGAIYGFEALVRWDDPGHGQRGAIEFITLAEETGDIVPLGRWVLDAACRRLAEWQAVPGAGELRMMINVSTLELRQQDFIEAIEGVVARVGLAPRSFVFEVTGQSDPRDDSRVETSLRRLRDLGIQLAIDDFGSGHHSLERLRSLPVEVLKVDRSLMAQADGRGQGSSLLRALVGVGAAMGAKVVAEGIESVAQLRLARSLGFHLGQGFALAEPLPAQDARCLLTAERLPWDDVLVTKARRREPVAGVAREPAGPPAETERKPRHAPVG